MQDRQPAAKAAASAGDALTGHSWHVTGERRWGEVKSNLRSTVMGLGGGAFASDCSALIDEP